MNERDILTTLGRQAGEARARDKDEHVLAMYDHFTNPKERPMRVLAIDPGPERSAYCLLEDGVPVKFGWDDNEWVIACVESHAVRHRGEDIHLAIEYVYLRGMKIFQQAVDTVFWVGRFVEAWGGPHTLVDRKDVKMTLCGNATANDRSIKIALVDRFGGPDVAIGGIKCSKCKGKKWAGRGRPPCDECWAAEDGPSGPPTGWYQPPGPLHGIRGEGSGHIWSSLAVGVTFLAMQEKESE